VSVLRIWLLRPVLLLVGTWPWLATWLGSESLLAVTRWVSRLFCHAVPGRALSLAGQEMPICSRCSGLLLGVAVGALLLRPRLQGRTLSVALALLVSMMLLHVIAQDLHLVPVHHPLRLLTGLALGWVASASLVRHRTTTCARPSLRTREPGLS